MKYLIIFAAFGQAVSAQNCAVESVCPKDILLLVLGAIFSVFVAFLLYSLKPRLRIRIRLVKNAKRPIFKIRVENRTWLSKAVNLKIEACFTEGHFTYHCEVDRGDFIMLGRRPLCGTNRDSYRVFQAKKLAPSAKEYDVNWRQHLKNLKAGDENFRVRVHANHEITGFGRAYEALYEYRDDRLLPAKD